MNFDSYCNCYSMPNGKIEVHCYDSVLEANNNHYFRSDDYRVDSRLVIMKKFWPTAIQKLIIQNEFKKPVILVSPKLSNNDLKA